MDNHWLNRKAEQDNKCLASLRVKLGLDRATMTAMVNDIVQVKLIEQIYSIRFTDDIPGLTARQTVLDNLQWADLRSPEL